MTPRYFIFPMILCDSDYSTLIGITEMLKSLSFDKLTATATSKHSLVHYLACAIIDIQEVTEHKCKPDYKFSSYLLNMACLKLTFVNELIQSKEPERLKEESLKIQITIRNINQILTLCYLLHTGE